MPRASIIWMAAAAAPALFAAAPAAACTVSATGVAFGVYDPRSAAPDDGTGSITLSCHPDVSGPTVALGTGMSASYAPRRMTGGATALDYNLHTTVARNIVWGDGTGGTATVTLSGGTVSAGTRTFNRTIYGRIPARQNVSAGTYSDTIVVTVTF